MMTIKKLSALFLALILSFGVISPAVAIENDYDVKIVKGSNINLVSQDSRVPILVQNNYDTEVRVLIHVSTSNLRVRLPRTTSVVIPANSTVNATVPVQAVANGDVTLNVWLTSFSGVRIGNSLNIEMKVLGNFEAIAIVSLGSLVLILLVVGTIRTIRRRKLAA
jgi:hypothetical protein